MDDMDNFKFYDMKRVVLSIIAALALIVGVGAILTYLIYTLICNPFDPYYFTWPSSIP